VTYRVGEQSLLRAAAARGFSVPPLAWASGGGLFLDPNPNLDQETVWSYQVGAETGALKYLWLKATFFRHEVSDTIEFRFMGGGPPAFNDILVNGGDTRRQGFELEAETLPFGNFSLLAGLCHVFLSPSSPDSGTDHLYKYTAGLRYDDKKSLQAELFGHYMWWDFAVPSTAEYDDFICDLNLVKTLYARDSTHGELFITAHNLFTGSLYTSDESKNPRRWIEGGFRVSF
jgi:vitamin B12 transporter